MQPVHSFPASRRRLKTSPELRDNTLRVHIFSLCSPSQTNQLRFWGHSGYNLMLCMKEISDA